MEISSFTSKQKIRLDEGGEIMYITTIPECKDFAAMTEFYKKTEERCRSFCTDKLPALLKNCSSQYRYRLKCTVTQEANTAEVKLLVLLNDRTSRRSLSRHEEIHIWKDGFLRRVKKAKQPSV